MHEFEAEASAGSDKVGKAPARIPKARGGARTPVAHLARCAGL